ncbi:MAG: NAD(P)-dependent oxidoreductase [Rhodospirillales bacterium]|nr:NAD(P)-dependent oxidoreductase [Rhodospirillales bacterium]
MSAQETNDRAGLRLAFMGFGEAASAFVSGWSEGAGLDIRAFDVKTTAGDEQTRAGKVADYVQAGVTGFDDPAAMLGDRMTVFSTVTADQSLVAARTAARSIRPGACYLDCNSCAPDTKRAASAVIEAAGGCYVDVAVMAPVYPKRHKVPLLISGPQAAAAKAVFSALEMEAEVVSDAVGFASSVKMIRSVMVKGMEALVLECVLSGRKAGVDHLVLSSLEKTFPGFGWEKRAAYMMERVATHGLRRAAEMREVALTVEQLGLFGDMARATVEWQQRVGELAVDIGEADYGPAADKLLAKIT